MADNECDAFILLFPDFHQSTLPRNNSEPAAGTPYDLRYAFGKLETALKFLGLNISEEQKVETL